MILLDTCALLWWTLEPGRLSARARRACGRIDEEGACISSVSIWEIGVKIKKGRLDIGDTIEGYVDRLAEIEKLRMVPVDERIWMRNLALEWDHRDPADRTIVATAATEGCAIVTKDPVIRGFYRRTIW